MSIYKTGQVIPMSKPSRLERKRMKTNTVDAVLYAKTPTTLNCGDKVQCSAGNGTDEFTVKEIKECRPAALKGYMLYKTAVSCRTLSTN